MRTPLRERVEAGAALLDKVRRRPAWRKRINLETLDLSSSCDCVLGQLYEGYTRGLDKVRIPYDEDEEYGFMPKSVPDVERLTRAWVRYIEATR